jgi:hypothetical protein
VLTVTNWPPNPHAGPVQTTLLHLCKRIDPLSRNNPPDNDDGYA